MKKVRVITDEVNNCSSIYQMNNFIFLIFKILKWMKVTSLSKFCNSWFGGFFVDLIGFEVKGVYKKIEKEVDDFKLESKNLKNKWKMYEESEWRRPY